MNQMFKGTILKRIRKKIYVEKKKEVEVINLEQNDDFQGKE